jgi:hypothetical protein
MIHRPLAHFGASSDLGLASIVLLKGSFTQMSPLKSLLRFHPDGRVRCPICHEPVQLLNAKTDEDGRAVHEACYVQQICQTQNSDGSSED